MRFSAKTIVGLALGATLLAGAPAVSALASNGAKARSAADGNRGLVVIGLTQDGRFIRFAEDRPGDARDIGRVRGLVGDSRLVGIDYRPANNVLYGVGNAGGVYTINDRTGQVFKRSQLSVGLEGNNFGVDFNPVVDRLRIVSDTGQNLRDNVDANGDTLTDGRLTYPAAPPAQPIMATGVGGAAYTNNDADPMTGTTLFDIDSMLDQTVIQSPANAGLLATTGKLRVDTSAVIGADIYSFVDDGTTTDLRGLASLTVGGKSRFYRLDLLQGRAHDRGSFSSRNVVSGIAIPLNQR